MYRDARLIKKHVVKVRLDDDINEIIEAICDKSGEQKAVFVRELVIKAIELHEKEYRPKPDG